MKNYPQIGLGLLAAALIVASAGSNQTLAGTRRLERAQFSSALPRFVDGVDNQFFPLRPGATFYYEGETDGVPTSDTLEVTHRTKVILGVTCIEVHDQGFTDGVLSESTVEWFAQDVAGNVWYFGEDTKELDANGNVTSTEGTWRAGVNGALPGIVMEAQPRVGDRYAQEQAPGVAQDQAQVLSLDASTTIPLGFFDDLLLTKETSPLEKGFAEHKYYAAGIGFIRSVVVKGGDEVTELVAVNGNGPIGPNGDN